MPFLSWCLVCKKKTNQDGKEPYVDVTSRGQPYLIVVCSECGKRKCCFLPRKGDDAQTAIRHHNRRLREEQPGMPLLPEEE